MNNLDIQVLQHWGANMKKAYKGELKFEDILGDKCCYCKKYGMGCQKRKYIIFGKIIKCPIFKYSKNYSFKFCSNTPWTILHSYFCTEFHSNELERRKIYEGTKNQFKFLTKVIKAKEKQNK